LGFSQDDFWVRIRIDDGQRNGDDSLGGAGLDGLLSLEETSDQGFIFAGYSTSDVTPGNDFNRKRTTNIGGADFWVVRSGFFPSDRVWEQTIGGTNDDIAYSVKQTRDRGFIVGGTSRSPPSGNKTAPLYGGSDSGWCAWM
jgi:hypothetical protein